MRRILKYIAYLLVLLPVAADTLAQQRFPRPDFESDYVTPTLLTPEPRQGWMEYFDVLVLLIVLSLATRFILKKRSRRSVLYLSIFTLAYFGFYRNGCICSIGAIQNVALSLADPGYIISFSALAFFILPLVFALFAGRVFCGGACPLGAIQDLIILKPIELPAGVRKALGMLPYLYLGLAVLYAVTRTDFIICRYDPFVGIFRMDASFNMLVLGAVFLIIGMFVGRPYCRFLCPYGVLLSWMSTFSKRHLSITPAECVDCKLCERSCPMDAIRKPVENPLTERRDVNRFVLSVLLIPVWIAACGYIVASSGVYLSKANRTVALADILIAHPEIKSDPDHIDVQTFLASGKSMEMLSEEVRVIQRQFYVGGWIVGGFFGLAFGLMFMNNSIYRRRKDYTPHRGDCVSCGRCMDYCPVGKQNFEQLVKAASEKHG